MKLLVGLGNPGRAYSKTRHNIGFEVVDLVAERLKIDISGSKFNSLFVISKIKNTDVCIIKPETFMNLSGDAVGAFARFYKVQNGAVLVVQDDMDMPLGRLKFVTDSGAGGHNGISSIIDHLGGKDFWRLKVGVGRPVTGRNPSDHVLEKFSKDERQVADKLIETAADAVISFYESGFEAAMQKFNGSLVSA